MHTLYVSAGGEARSAGSSGTHGDARDTESVLLQVLQHLERALNVDPNLTLEAKSWLIETVASLRNVDPSTSLACFLGAASGPRHCAPSPGAGRRGGAPPSPHTPAPRPGRAAERQLLRLACQLRRGPVSALLASSPSVLRAFFSRSDAVATAWFGGFSAAAGGIGAFQPGAAALANYALAHRDEAWRHLVWAGKHPQAPVAVAAKPHYFGELDVAATVRNLLGSCPEFWESRELRQSLEGGLWMELDEDFCVQELHDRLHGGSRTWRDDVAAELQALVMHCDWRTLCQQVLPLMGERELLGVLRALAEHHYAPQHGGGGRMGLRAWALGGIGGGIDGGGGGDGDDSPLVLADVVWDDVRDALLCNALVCRAPQLLRLLSHDEEARGELDEVEQLGEKLHGSCSGGGGGGGGRVGEHGGAARSGQQAFLRRLDPRSPRGRLLLALDAWTLRMHLRRRAAAEPPGEAAERLLAGLRWRWERRDGGGAGSGGGGAGTSGDGAVWSGGKPEKGERQKQQQQERQQQTGRGREEQRLLRRQQRDVRPAAHPDSRKEAQQQQEEQQQEEQQQQEAPPEDREPLSRGRSKRKRRRSPSRSRSSGSGSRSRSPRDKKRHRRKKKKRRKEKRRRRGSSALNLSSTTASAGTSGSVTSIDSVERGASGASRGGGSMGDGSPAGASCWGVPAVQNKADPTRGHDTGHGCIYIAWPPGGGCVSGGPSDIMDGAARWACRQWVRALLGL